MNLLLKLFLILTLFMNPMEGDLKGYCSGKWTRTFQTPPSYGVPLGPKNFTTNSSRPPSIVTSCFDSINFITSVSIRRFPALGDDILSITSLSTKLSQILTTQFTYISTNISYFFESQYTPFCSNQLCW